MEFACTVCDDILNYGDDFIFIWTFHREGEATSRNTIRYCQECVYNKEHTIELQPYCIVCSKMVFTCKYVDNNSLDECKHCIEIPFTNFNNIVHKPICSFECLDAERKKLFAAEGMSMQYRCSYCRQLVEKMRRCSHCKKTYYCDVTCQRNHWPAHKIQCKQI